MTGARDSETRILLLAGEKFQRLERLNDILNTVVEGPTRDFNLDVIYPEDFSPKNLSDLVVTFPMMAARRVVVLRDFDRLKKNEQKRVSEIAANTPVTTLIIIEGEKAKLSPVPKQHTRTETFKPVYDNQLPAWIRERFRKRGKTIDENGIMLLINNVGGVLGELNSEMEKILIITGEADFITGDDVQKVVGSFKRDTVYSLCDAVGLGNFGETVRILNNLIATEKGKETYYIGSLISHIMKLSEYNRLIKNGIPHKEAYKVVITSSYLWKEKRCSDQARRLKSPEVRRALTVLARLESNLKRSSIDKKLMMDMIVPFLITGLK